MEEEIDGRREKAAMREKEFVGVVVEMVETKRWRIKKICFFIIILLDFGVCTRWKLMGDLWRGGVWGRYKLSGFSVLFCAIIFNVKNFQYDYSI